MNFSKAFPFFGQGLFLIVIRLVYIFPPKIPEGAPPADGGRPAPLPSVVSTVQKGQDLGPRALLIDLRGIGHRAEVEGIGVRVPAESQGAALDAGTGIGGVPAIARADGSVGVVGRDVVKVIRCVITIESIINPSFLCSQ